MSFKSLLISKATIWNVTEGTAFGISESTSFSVQIDCRIRDRSGSEDMRAERETNIGTHVIYMEAGTDIDTTNQLVSEGTIYHVQNVRQPFGRRGRHHMAIDVEVVK